MFSSRKPAPLLDFALVRFPNKNVPIPPFSYQYPLFRTITHFQLPYQPTPLLRHPIFVPFFRTNAFSPISSVFTCYPQTRNPLMT